MARVALSVLLAGVIVLVAGPADVVARAPERVFARTSFWNVPLPRSAARDSQSRALSGALRAEVERETRARTGPWINTGQYSVPVYTVGPRTRRVHVRLDA